MVLDLGAVFMDQVDGAGAGSGRPSVEPCGSGERTAPHNGLPAQPGSRQGAERRSSPSLRGRVPHRPPLRRPLSLDATPQHLRAGQEPAAEKRLVQPPWRSGSAAPARSLTSPSLGAGSWMRRSESTCSVNRSLGRQAGRGWMRPATSLPHIAKGAEVPARAPSKPCLLVALRPLNVEQEKQLFFQSHFKHEPQFAYVQPEPRAVLDKYGEGSGLFLEQVRHRAPPSHTHTHTHGSVVMGLLRASAGSGNHGVCLEEVWLL